MISCDVDCMPSCNNVLAELAAYFAVAVSYAFKMRWPLYFYITSLWQLIENRMIYRQIATLKCQII
jgi:hypothetical protein